MKTTRFLLLTLVRPLAPAPVVAQPRVPGATFRLSGRLLALDSTGRALVEVSPETGQEVGTATGLSTNVAFPSTAGDLTRSPDGSLALATPMPWPGLPASANRRFYRVRVR